MPELIEVLVTGQYLNLKLKNKFISDINIIGGRYKKHKNSLNELKILIDNLPSKIINVNSKKKFVV